MPKRDQVILSEGGNRYRLCEDAREKEDNGLRICTAKAFDESNNRFCFLKFAYENDGTVGIHNIDRENNFRFYYPYILPVISSFNAVDSEGKKLYCVSLEYIEGMDLKKYWKKQTNLVREGKLEEKERERAIFRQMLQFLYGVNYYTNFADFAQKDSYLHRDLKPENIMIDKEENAVIVDFDYSHKEGSTNTERFSDWVLGGTAGYLDPKVYKERKSDVKTEIYSMGRVFFYWLNGKSYFTEQESENWSYCYDRRLAYSLEESRFSEKKYLQDKYKRLTAIIRKMCAEPEERYRKVEEIILEFQEFLLEYCGNSVKKYEDYIKKEQMPLLQKRSTCCLEKTPTVLYQVSPPGECRQGHPLLNYTMRNIKVEGKQVMTIYHLDGIIYYIPYMKGLVRDRSGNDFEIQSGDEFIFGSYTIKFWIYSKNSSN